MKKVIFLVLLVFLSIHVFAIDFSLSAGGGGLLGYNFSRYTLEGGSVKSKQSMDRINYGGFLFFDAAYAVLSVMIQGGNSSYSENMIFDAVTLPGDGIGKGYETSLGFSLLGKYPFTVNEKVSWFPMLGVEYQIALVQRRQPDISGIVYDRTQGHLPEDRDKNNKPYSLSAWNSLWINIGAGLDYYITNAIFLRSELLFGFRLPTSYEMGALEVVKNPPMNVSNPRLAGLTGGPTLKIGAGYRF